MSTEPERGVALVLKWAYTHGSVHAREYATLNEAVESALWAADAGNEAVDSIEVFYDDGTSEVHDRDAVDALMAPIEERQYRAMVEATTNNRPVVTLDILAPNGVWSVHGDFKDAAEAEDEANRLRRLLGSDRVHLRPFGDLHVGHRAVSESEQ